MTRGRKPETAEQQDAKGAPGNRMSQAERQAVQGAKPKPVSVGKTQPPKWLKRSSSATKIWNEIAPLLQRLNLLTDLDAQAFARYCRYVAEWIIADQVVRKEGTWFNAVGTNGEATKKRHPAWQAMQDIEKMLREMEATFGMRPDARYKIMRDQAAAHGFGALPLFGGQGSPSNGDRKTTEPEDSDHQDVIGALGAFNSSPPDLLN